MPKWQLLGGRLSGILDGDAIGIGIGKVIGISSSSLSSLFFSNPLLCFYVLSSVSPLVPFIILVSQFRFVPVRSSFGLPVCGSIARVLAVVDSLSGLVSRCLHCWVFTVLAQRLGEHPRQMRNENVIIRSFLIENKTQHGNASR